MVSIGNNALDDDVAPAVGTEAVIAAESIRKRKPSHDMCRRVWTLHENLGHAEMRNISQQIKNGTAGEVDVSPWEIDLVISYQHCLSCAIAKWKRFSEQPSSGVHETIVGHSYSIDYEGPFAVKALGGFTGKFTCVELTTGLGIVNLVKEKGDLYSIIKLQAQYNSKWGHVMRVLRVDAGTVENSSQFGEVCSSLNGPDRPGVEVRPAAVEKQNQNPVERHIQTINNHINAMLVGTDTLSSRFGGWASIYAWKTRNHIRNKLCPDSTPIFLVEGKNTNFSHFKYKFGQTIITRRIGPAKKHVTNRNELGIVVCPVLYNGTVLVYLPERGHDFVAPRADVRALMVGSKEPTMSVIDGQKYMPALKADGTIGLVTRGDTGFLSQKYILELDAKEHSEEPIYGSSLDRDTIIPPSLFDSSEAPDILFPDQTVDGSCSMESVVEMDPVVDRDLIEPCTHLIRPRRPTHLPSQYANLASRPQDPHTARIRGLLHLGTCMILNMKSPDVSALMSNASLLSSGEFNNKNPTWGQAMKRPDRDSWIAADLLERKQYFETKKTFQPVVEGRLGVPRGCKILPLKRHCKIKLDGTYKVRWVALRNLDNFEGDTFAPTASKKIVYLVFAVSLLLGLHMRWYDIGGAFMAEKPTRTVYVEIDGDVYILLKSLYGLTDSHKVFNDGLVSHLVNGGYVQSKWDQCLFVKWISDKEYIYIIFHVDDFTVSCTSESLHTAFEQYLRTKYTEVSVNEDGMFLGIQCAKKSDGSMVFTKPFQLLSIFEKFLPNGPVAVPKDPMTKAYVDNFLEDSPIDDSGRFRSLLGALMQLNDVRADIVFPLSKIATRTETPRVKDFDAMIHIVHYLHGTQEKGLCLRPGRRACSQTILKLRAYADCGFANNAADGRSQYCICFDIVPAADQTDDLSPIQHHWKTGMFYYKSAIAKSVDLCTTEGECGTVVEAMKDVILYRGVLLELHQPQIEPTPVYNDNKSTITLATNYNGMHKHVRYMLTRVNWLMEKSKEQIYKLLYMKSEDLPADFGTKFHAGAKRLKLADAVMGGAH